MDNPKATSEVKNTEEKDTSKWQKLLQYLKEEVPKILEARSDKDYKKDVGDKSLQYSIALSIIFITFGFWFFDYMKHQHYFSIDYTIAWIIIIVSTISVTSGIFMMLHILLSGLLISSFDLLITRHYVKNLSVLFFQFAFFLIALFIGSFIIFLVSLPFCIIAHYLQEVWIWDILFLVVLVIFTFFSMVDITYSSMMHVTKRNTIDALLINILVLISCMILLFFVGYYFLDNSTELMVYTDKHIYNINSDKMIIITVKVISLPQNPRVPGSTYRLSIDGPDNNNYDVVLTQISTDELTGVFPIKDKGIGNYKVQFEYNVVREHKVDIHFLVCNVSESPPCVYIPKNVSGGISIS